MCNFSKLDLDCGHCMYFQDSKCMSPIDRVQDIDENCFCFNFQSIDGDTLTGMVFNLNNTDFFEYGDEPCDCPECRAERGEE